MPLPRRDTQAQSVFHGSSCTSQCSMGNVVRKDYEAGGTPDVSERHPITPEARH